MTEISKAWGQGPSPRYEALAAPFRPVFARIAERAAARDLERDLPFDEIGWLREAGFPAIRIPAEAGGPGATLPELFALMIELSAADPNVTNALRSHFGFVEDVVSGWDGPWRRDWIARILDNQTIGSGLSETGGKTVTARATRLERQGEGWLLNGVKFYTTGALYADWVIVNGHDHDGALHGALVPASAPGVEIIDDWDGFGQSLTASGTIRFTDVAVAPEFLLPDSGRFSYAQGFFQLVHLATLAGIARAAGEEVVDHVRRRGRVYDWGNAARTGDDPQILAVVGQVRSAAYVAGAVTLKAAEALARAEALNGSPDADAQEEARVIAGVEVSQGVSVVPELVLNATTRLFDALGASAVRRGAGLDRHWRNARTVTSHNPRVFHDRMVGDHAVNGRAPDLFRSVAADPLSVGKRG